MQTKRALAFILTATALAFTGCTNHSSTSFEAEPQPQPVLKAQPVSYILPSRSTGNGDNATDARPLIVCFGDSLTSGRGLDSPDLAYPADLQRLLNEQGYHYRVLNDGISGNTTKDGVERLPQVLEHHPQIVVVEFGGNDGLRGLPVSTTQSNLATIIQRLQEHHIQVALAGITLPPEYGGVYIQHFNAMYPALAHRFHVPLLPMLLTGVWNVPGLMQEDGVHPTAQGAQQVAKNVDGLIKPLLKH